MAVSAKNNRWCNDRDAVVVNDQVYIIDTQTGQAYHASVDGARSLPPANKCSKADE